MKKRLKRDKYEIESQIWFISIIINLFVANLILPHKQSFPINNVFVVLSYEFDVLHK